MDVLRIAVSYLEPHALIPFFLTNRISLDTAFRYDASNWIIDVCCEASSDEKLSPYEWKQIFSKFKNIIVTGISLQFFHRGKDPRYNLEDVFDELELVSVERLEKVKICAKGMLDISVLSECIGLKEIVIGKVKFRYDYIWGCYVDKIDLRSCTGLIVADMGGCYGCEQILLPLSVRLVRLPRCDDFGGIFGCEVRDLNVVGNLNALIKLRELGELRGLKKLRLMGDEYDDGIGTNEINLRVCDTVETLDVNNYRGGKIDVSGRRFVNLALVWCEVIGLNEMMYDKLEDFKVEKCDMDLGFLGKCCKLRSVEIRNMDGLESMCFLNECYGLTKLRLWELVNLVKIGDDGMLSRLESVEIRGCNGVDYSVLGRCSRLKEVILMNWGQGNPDLIAGDFLEGCVELEHVELMGFCVETCFRNLRQLKKVGLERCGDLDGLGVLSKCSKLEEVEIVGNVLEGVWGLGEMESLKKVKILNCRSFYWAWRIKGE